jgi:hypothetical protein
MTPSMAQIMDPETRRQLNLESLRRTVEQKDTDVSLYGKVLDQNNDPVAGATISFLLTHYSLFAEGFHGAVRFETQTDDAGLFSVDGKRGFNLSVTAISRDGYEYLLSQNPKDYFQYWPGLTKSFLFVPDRNNPVVFRLRKRGETTFLIDRPQWGVQFHVNETTGSPEARTQVKASDFVRVQAIRDLNRLVFNGQPLYPDLVVMGVYNELTTSWTVVLMPGEAGGGILASEVLLYEAPAEGYRPSVQFVAEDRKPPKAQYFYLRSRDPAIYSRIEVHDVIISRPEGRLVIGGKRATNPYGERVLDTVPDIPYEVTSQLQREIREAFKAGRRPVKPDLPRLIQEAKEKEAIDR